MKHAVVVGGTGMLSNVSLWLMDNGYHVSVIARNTSRMEKLIEQASSKKMVTPLLVDYTNGTKLRDKIRETIQKNGDVDIVVAWIHSTANISLSVIAKEVSNHKNKWELFHVLGSSSNLEKLKRKVPVPTNCLYNQVQLGFVIEGVHSRWLTHQEISNGVIETIKKRKQIHIIGVIEPWEKRPF